LTVTEEAIMSQEPESQTREKQQQQEELAAYDKLRQNLKKILSEIHENVNADTLRHAVDKAGAQLKEVGEHTAEAVNKAAAALKKDLASVGAKLEPKWEALAGKTGDLFDAWRDRSSVFLGQASRALGDWLQQLSSRLEHPSYQTGEMTFGGTFECTACGEQVTLDKAGHLPPCPKCYKTEFRRT